MANGVNKVYIIGRLGQDPECKPVSSGMVAKFTVATSESYIDKKTNEKKELTEWHKVTAWGKLAEIIQKYVKKGSLVHIEGKIKTDKFTDKEGNERYMTGIVANSLMMLDSKGRSDEDSGNTYSKTQEGSPFDYGSDDQIPF